MREIKFRAWDSYLKKMVFEGFHIWGEVTEFDLIKLHCYENPNPDYKHSLQRANDMVFMQFTGLKDKNGKEIYEGDIVRTDQDQWSSKCAMELPKGIYPVTFDNGCFKIVYDIEEILTSLFDKNVCEVIGNIYENPELTMETK